jgi:ABC-type transport system substrate-binding protein/class 3 adenylate cyclase
MTTESQGERRIVSVLLADIADSTTIGEQLGPERSKFLFDEVVRLIAAEIKRYGGTVAQFTGDGLYALFGVPTAHEDDAERAVRAALAVHVALAGYGRDVAEAYGIELSARVGVNTGPVVLLAEDAPPEERYNALGDTVNVAARLQSHAGQNGVAVGPTTARQLEDAFELEPLGPLELKGKAEPLEAFRVVGEREGAPRRISPLIGREAELEALGEVMGDLAEGKGAIVAVTGEAGIGKSRLVAEIRDRWSDSVRFLGAQGVSYAQDVPYYPLRELLRGFLGLGASDPEARVRLELKARLAANLGDRAETYYPFLALLLGLALEDELAERLGGLARDSIQRQTHEAVIELCRSLSREQPLCLVLEDLHFADEPTLELCEELLALVEDDAVSLFLLYRSDPDLPSWELGETAHRQYRHRFRELHLEPLAATEGALLAASAAGGELPPELAAELAERTGGNPLFLEEAARDLVERGNGAVVPTAIQETLQARLGRLAHETREVAAVASVIGRTFGDSLLERLVAPERLRPALSELQRLDLVVEERRRPTREYRFRHGLVQEAAYRSLLDDRRRDLHRVVGTTLEELHGDELSEAYGLLARHFTEADEPEKAARYLLEAGDAARAVYADDEAIAQYRRALPFLERLGDTGRARGVLFKMALAHHLAFDFEAADDAWQEAFRLLEPPPRRLEPTERIETTLREPVWTPGHGYDLGAWSFGTNFFRGLLQLDRGGDVVPDLAEHATVSTDGCTYRFQLREGLCWSDGAELTADDFAFTYSAMQEHEVFSAHLVEGIQGTAIDQRTLELRLPEPRTWLLYLLALFGSFPWPRHRVESLGDDWQAPENLVCNGPFRIAEVGEGSTVSAANPFWSGSRGNVREIVFGHRDPAEVLDEWGRGRYDLLFNPFYMVQGEIPTSPDTIVLHLPLLSTDYLGLPSRPPFDDARVRKALAHALDRTSLEGSVASPAAGGFVPPAMPGHSHDIGLRYDPPLARSLLAEAGYTSPRELPTLRLIQADPGFGHETRRRLEAIWESQWREVNLRVEQVFVPHKDVYSEADADATFLHWAWVSDFPDPYGMLAPFLATNTSLGHDTEVMSLLDRAGAVRSRDERLRLCRAMDRRLVEEAWVIPTVYDRWPVIHRPWLEGVWGTSMVLGPLNDVVVRR